MKIHRDNVLLLEVPLASGKTGRLLIDITGAPNGVSSPSPMESLARRPS